MILEKLSDESIERYYESIRQQAEADRAHKHHFTRGMGLTGSPTRTNRPYATIFICD